MWYYNKLLSILKGKDRLQLKVLAMPLLALGHQIDNAALMYNVYRYSILITLLYTILYDILASNIVLGIVVKTSNNFPQCVFSKNIIYKVCTLHALLFCQPK